MPRFAPAMTLDSFKSIIVNIAVENDAVEELDLDINNPNFERLFYFLIYETCFEKVNDDWSKVEFSTENVMFKKFIMLHDTIPCALLEVGGDWEFPLAACVYYDGKNLRGYIPKNGNTYNYATKSAFGNAGSDDEHDDESAIFKQYGKKVDIYNDGVVCDLDKDWGAIIADCTQRISPKGEYIVKQKNVKSKSTVLKEKQAQIESNIDLSGDITPDMVYAVINLAADGAYVEFVVRQSGRMLTEHEVDRVVGVPSNFTKYKKIFYSPRGVYPAGTQKLLSDAGFEKCPNNDISMYENRRTHIIYI